MDAARQGLQAVHVAGSGGAKVLLVLAALFAAIVDTSSGQDVLGVVVFELAVDVDVVGVQDLRVVDGLQNGLLQDVREEGILVGGLVAAHKGLEAFLFTDHPVEQAVFAVGDADGARLVDGGVEGELDALNQVEGDGVLEPADGISASLS